MNTDMPLGGYAPPIRCGRLLRWPDESSACPNDATWHIIWTPECENTIDCDEHKVEAEGYPHVAIHPYRMECSMPGATFVPVLNVCVVDEGYLGLPAAEEALAHA